MDRKLDVKAGAWAGIAAGALFIVLEMALVMMIQGESPWAPPRMIAAIGMGERVLPPPATFDAGIFTVAMAIHFALAVLLALILGWIISRLRFGMVAALIGGALFGLAVYVVNFYGFTAMFPWFAMARGPIGIVAHVLFGAVAGGVYHALESRSPRPAADAAERPA